MTRKNVNLALCFELPSMEMVDSKYTPPVWLPMIPAGQFTGRDGRSWSNNTPEAFIAQTQLPVPFDIEHATELLAPQGHPAPAQGWIEELQIRDGQIFGRIEWNEDGCEVLCEKKYRWYSPAFRYDQNGSVTALSSAGLTNKPNLYTPALNSEGSTVLLPEKVAQALGLQTTASDDDAVSAIAALKTAEQVALNRQQAPDPTKFITVETHQLALNRAESAEQQLKTREEADVSALVESAITDGKIAPANKAMYLALCRTEEGRTQFKSFVATAPKIVAQDPSHQAKPGEKGALSDDELALCRQMAVSPEEFLAAKATNSKE